MDGEWNDSQPIFRQVRDRITALILDEVLKAGDAVPSVRTIAGDYRINPLTVMKAYQGLVDERLLEKRRGLGLFVRPGARDLLLARERRRFLEDRWPEISATIRRLALTAQELRTAAGEQGLSDDDNG